MKRIDSVLRWSGAVGITLAPLGLFVLPGLMHPEPYETLEEQATAFAEGNGGEYLAQATQLSSAVFLMVAALGIGGFTIVRGRGRTLGTVGLTTGMIAGISILVVMGFELCMQGILHSGMDTDSAVSLVVELSAGPAFMIPILIGLVGFYLTLPLLAFALWRSKVVPIVVPLLFALPVLSGFVPLPFDATVTGGVLMLVPCVWMSVQLIRGVPIRPVASPINAVASDHA